MKILLSFLAACSYAALLAIPAGALTLQQPASGQRSAPDLRPTLEPALLEFVAAHRIPGLAIGVVKDGRVLYARGFGEKRRGSGKPITTKSIFHMASVSKPFTATAAMQLVEAGKLELEAPLTKYLPYFRLAEEESKTITVRQVLTHTSGFPDVRDYEWDRPQHDPGAAERYVRSLTSEGMLFSPGEGSSYSNMAFDTLGDVIAKVSGMSFDDYVRTRILEPLGMVSTSFVHAETPEEHRTQGHSVAFSERIDNSPCPVYPYNRRHGPSSTLNSNVEDMCRWMIANLQRGELAGKRILNAASYEVLWAREDDTPDIGLSWFLTDFEGRFCVNHSGADTGFRSYCGLLPEEQLGVVVMGNADTVPAGNLGAAALRATLGLPFTLPRPSLSQELAYLLEKEGSEAAIERYLELRDNAPDDWDFSFDELDQVVRLLVRKERHAEAAELAALNADIHSSLSVAFTRLGQVLAASGDPEGARENFQHALQLAPGDGEARAGLDAL